MARIIRLPYGKAKQLAERCGIARSTVRMALEGVSLSDQADTVRRLALEEFGGYYSQKQYKKVIR